MNQMDRKNYKYQPQFAVGNVGQYAYYHDEDESQFTLVDQSKVVKTAYQKKIKSIQNVMKFFSIETVISHFSSFFFFRKIFVELNFNSINIKNKIIQVLFKMSIKRVV